MSETKIVYSSKDYNSASDGNVRRSHVTFMYGVGVCQIIINSFVILRSLYVFNSVFNSRINIYTILIRV